MERPGGAESLVELWRGRTPDIAKHVGMSRFPVTPTMPIISVSSLNGGSSAWYESGRKEADGSWLDERLPGR